MNAINVTQGDSLIYTRAGIAIGNQENVPYYTIETPLHRLMGVPVSWTDQESFNDDLNRLVQAANSMPPRPMPIGIATGLSADDAKMIENTFRTLIEVCRHERDSVWGWYFQNIVGPSKLRRRKVDRILANPPWVRMSHIQTPERKSELEALADELGIWGHGKANTSFDIAGLFVKRCAMNYLAADGGRAAWVLPQGALDGANWINVRGDGYIRAGADCYMDLGKVRRAPFTVESCVWLQTHGQGHGKPDDAEDDAPQPGDVPTKILMNLGDAAKIESYNSWGDVKTRTHWVDALRKLPQQVSGYLAPDNRPLFRQGASLVPHCLVVVDLGTLTMANNTASFTTAPSSKRPWSDKGTLNGRDVPVHWIRNAAFSTELFPFAMRRQLDKVVLPLTLDGDYDDEANINSYWVNAESVYQDNRGLGTNTPATLWERLNFQNGLTRQTASAADGEDSRKVIYNKSGRIGLRAARIPPDTITNDTLYHFTCFTESEAAYLTALLNADCLQEAYRQSQKARRDFHQHFWRTVPIPKYDSRVSTHRTLARLCAQAEEIAQSVRDSFPDSIGQIKVSAAIHEELRERGIAARIDAAARRLMPEQAS